MSIDIIIRISNFHVVIDMIVGYSYIYVLDLENKGVQSTLFWIITALPILLYSSSIFIAFMLSNTEHKFNTIFDVLLPPFFSLIAFLFGDFDYYVRKMKINEISKSNSLFISWLINSICEFFISIPKAYVLFICENNYLKEKPELYNANSFLIQSAKYLTYIGCVKGVITILIAFFSFIKFVLDDTISLNDNMNNKKEVTNQKKSE